MTEFAWEPNDNEVAELVKLRATPGWAIFLRMLQESYNQTAVDAIDKSEAPGGHALAYYKGYLDSLREAPARVDYYIDELLKRRTEESDAARLGLDRPLSSAGDTAS